MIAKYGKFLELLPANLLSIIAYSLMLFLFWNIKHYIKKLLGKLELMSIEREATDHALGLLFKDDFIKTKKIKKDELIKDSLFVQNYLKSQK